ncbi:unnamed protein product [Bursaphelenchus okinawaensis]|uniref:Uncharacterized protein n=1 Tax=Bursaphelenchus okinawaensis TaxID=465554 RepID=A0A811L4G5_9BILA|nr:unnamed protein product [Bursaphelenchus okinawaensis]CAG9119484.1 unnamed protein product [Bursaphelenchus okinawaensis]
MVEYFSRSYHTPNDRYKPNNNAVNGAVTNNIRYYTEDELNIPMPNSFFPTLYNGELTYNYYPMSSSTSSSSYQPSSDYVQQEEEWDRDALLDPLWEQQQKKTFTAWINSHLRKAGTKIDSLEHDFQNGLKLMLLLEVISGQTLPKPDKGRTRFHKIANVSKALQYIQSRGVKLVSVGPEEVVDGNVKLTLGLIWTIILRFAIQEISVGAHSARDGLLLWCQRKTEPYDDVDIQNFSTSWKDGLAFCALIHRHRPDLLDYPGLNPREHLTNLKTAFDVAEKELDIPKMLEPEVLVNSSVPDEKAVMTYVSSFYHKFTGKNKLEKAANRIGRVLTQNRENVKMADDYELLADDLLTWIDTWMPVVSNRNEETDSEALKRRMSKFRHYRQNEKPPRIEEKSQLETLFNTLQNRLRLANRPAFQPRDGQSIREINMAWNNLEQSEKGYEEWLLSEVMRLQRLERLAEKFYRKCAAHNQWCLGKEEKLKSNDYKSADCYNIKAIRKRHEAIESDMEGHQERIGQIVQIAKELTRLQYAKALEVAEKCEDVVVEWETLGQLAKSRRSKITEAEKIVKELDEIHLKLAKQLGPFHSWLDSVKEDLNDIVIVNQMDEVESLLEDHRLFNKTLPEAESTLNKIRELHKRTEDIVRTNKLDSSLLRNPYTDFSVDKIEKMWREMEDLLPKRESQLKQEKNRQQKSQQLQSEFAEKANIVGPWLEDLLEQVLTTRSTPNTTLESTLADLKVIKDDAFANKHELTELEKINHNMHENMIFEAPTSKYTMESLRVGWESLMTALNKVSNEVENQILLRDSKGLTNDQLKEYRRAFVHFDIDSKGLNEEQLKAFLISIGNEHGDVHELFKQLDVNNLGYVGFEAVIDYLTKENTDQDKAEQMIEAFRLLANGRSAVTEDEIRKELPPKLASYCIKQLKHYHDPSDRGYDYETFCRNIFIH